jgi:hypothetical protein
VRVQWQSSKKLKGERFGVVAVLCSSTAQKRERVDVDVDGLKASKTADTTRKGPLGFGEQHSYPI